MGTMLLDDALNWHIEEILSKRESSLEETKNLALAIWKFICEKRNSMAAKKVSVRQYYSGKVTVKINASDGTDAFLCTFPSNNQDKELLELLSIIAQNSNENGKIFSSKNEKFRQLLLEYK